MCIRSRPNDRRSLFRGIFELIPFIYITDGQRGLSSEYRL